jgi:error-prone DNA polymerase
LREGRAGAFSHLHVRSGFSYGFGVAAPEELVAAARDSGMSSIALTDRDGMHGIPRFLRAADEAGISGVIGAEVTVELRKSGGERPLTGHVVLLAEGGEGYRTLCRLLTAYRTSSEDRRHPACPLPLLLEHAGRPGAGLVCLTGAIPFGFLPRLLLARDTGLWGKSREVAGLLREAFGSGNLYAELTDDRTAGSRRRLARVSAFAEGLGLPTLAAGEVSYLSPRDHRLHEVLAAASARSALPGPGYRPTDRLHLRPAEGMERLFASYPEALENARAVAERCAGSVRLGETLHLPATILPDGESPEKKLFALALAGARNKYRASGEAGWVDRGRLKARLKRELSCINSLGFAGYFLIAHEAVAIAKEKGIPVTGRGSAANSLVSYCLGLTQPEPFANRLLFERFLHEGREDPPDVDLDLCSKRRDEVRDELIGRYDAAGRGAAVAATANTLSLRGAVRVAARALGHEPAEIDALSRGVPRRAGSWAEALEEPSMRGNPIREDREGHALLMELSMGLRGRLWQAGTHLGGLVFGTLEAHLSELVPLEPSGRPGLMRCQYDKDDLEYCGIPKLDLLGLRTHTALAEAGEHVGRKLGRRVDPLSPPPDDKETYRLIRSGKTAGMFQLESPGQMNLSGRLMPRRFSDLVAQISLFRPGPVRGDLVTPYVLRRNAREPYSVALPDLEEVLGPTYGILLFQEQVLEVAQRVAGFSLAEGDGLRRAMTKDRGPGAMKGLKSAFLERARARGVPKGKAEEVFSWMEGFAAYGFSAAHAASFAELSYASAYMRTHHPAEFSRAS